MTVGRLIFHNITLNLRPNCWKPLTTLSLLFHRMRSCVTGSRLAPSRVERSQGTRAERKSERLNLHSHNKPCYFLREIYRHSLRIPLTITNFCSDIFYPELFFSRIGTVNKTFSSILYPWATFTTTFFDGST